MKYKYTYVSADSWQVQALLEAGWEPIPDIPPVVHMSKGYVGGSTYVFLRRPVEESSK